MEELVFFIARFITSSIRLFYAAILIIFFWLFALPSFFAEIITIIMYVFFRSFFSSLQEIKETTSQYKLPFYIKNLVRVSFELLQWSFSLGSIKYPDQNNGLSCYEAVSIGAAISTIPIILFLNIAFGTWKHSFIVEIFAVFIGAAITCIIIYIISNLLLYPIYRNKFWLQE